MTTTGHYACPPDDGQRRGVLPDLVEVWPPLWSRAQWLRLDWWRRTQHRPQQRLWWDPAVDSLCDALVRPPRSRHPGNGVSPEDSLSSLVAALGVARAQARVTAEETVRDLEDLWQAYAAEPVPIALVAAALQGWTSVAQRDEGPR